MLEWFALGYTTNAESVKIKYAEERELIARLVKVSNGHVLPQRAVPLMQQDTELKKSRSVKALSVAV